MENTKANELRGLLFADTLELGLVGVNPGGRDAKIGPN